MSDAPPLPLRTTTGISFLILYSTASIELKSPRIVNETIGI